MALATVTAGAMFAASSGSSIATTASLGTVASKEMVKSNYSKASTSGSTIAGGSFSILIPPSTFMVMYGVLAQQHIGKLLMAGLLPGLLLTLLYILTVVIVLVKIKPDAAEKGEGHSWTKRFKSLSSTVPIVVLFVFVIGGLFIGLFGPTEAASVGAFGAAIIAIIRRKLTLRVIGEVLENTLKTVGTFLGILLSALLLNSFIVRSGLQLFLNNFLTGLTLAPVFIFILIVLVCIIFSTFMDSMAAMLVTFPITLPLVETLGYDLILRLLIVIFVILMELALITPPIGMSTFVLNGVAPELKLSNIYKGGLIFCIPILILIVLIYVIPDIVLLLPSNL